MMKRIILTSLIAVTASGATNRENLEREMLVLTQKLSSAQSESERETIRKQLDALKASFQTPTPESPLNTGSNSSLYRDTYFFRGPVVDNTAGTPLLNYSFERNYSDNPNLVEGAPVMSYNNPMAHINQVPGMVNQTHRNPYTNPTGVAPYQAQNQYGSQYMPGFQMGNGMMMPPYGGSGAYPGSMPNGGYPNLGYGQMPGYGYGQMPGYGYQQRPGYGYGYPYNNGMPQNNVQYQNQVTERASFDAINRFRQELNLDPFQTGADAINIEVVEKSRLQNGQIQVVLKTSGGITGQGIGKTRVYLYASNGQFMQTSDTVSQNQTQVMDLPRYQVSNQQKFSIDRWLTEQGMNRYGDPLGTMYAGGNPLMDIKTGGVSDESTRYSLIIKKHPQLVSLFKLQAAN